jgi:Zn-finger nucleic acid-binding protein
MDLKLQRENVIYLYRNAIDTIYSQLRYYKENPDDQERRRHWADLYARHLSKWLVNENFTRKKTVLTYEGMKSHMAGEFAKVCSHFGEELDAGRLENVLARVSKEELKKKTRHDSQVVDLTGEYENERENFRNKYSDYIFEEIYRVDKKLENILRNLF